MIYFREDGLLQKKRLSPVRFRCRRYCESDSGGHTDNQAISALFPSIVQLRDTIVREYTLSRPIHLGAAGLGDPQGVAAAFAMGADFSDRFG